MSKDISIDYVEQNVDPGTKDNTCTGSPIKS